MRYTFAALSILAWAAGALAQEICDPPYNTNGAACDGSVANSCDNDDRSSVVCVAVLAITTSTANALQLTCTDGAWVQTALCSGLTKTCNCLDGFVLCS